MELEIKNTFVSTEHVQPTLIAKGYLICKSDLEAPLNVSGELLVGGKILSPITIRHDRPRNGVGLKHITEEVRRKNFRENIHDYYPVDLLVPLSKKQIDFLCKTREANEAKSLELTYRLSVKAMNIETSSFNQGELFLFKVEECIERKTITRENWIKYFTEKLDIGSFYLIELRKPTISHYNDKWVQLSKSIQENISQMEKSLHEADWQRCIELSRLFFENIKIGDFRSGSQSYKRELSQKLFDLGHDEVGIKNLFDGINNLFQFVSKFLHEKDQEGNPKPRPIAQKEDAYFIYSLSINLANVIFSKLNRSPV